MSTNTTQIANVGADLSNLHVAIAYKNFAAWKGLSHIGLGVTAVTNSQVLATEGVEVNVFPVRHNVDIVDSIREYEQKTGNKLSHVVISAPWLSTRDVTAMITHFKHIQFTINSHSNVGFLQADPQGVRLLREALALSKTHPNIRVAGNSKKFVRWLQSAYGEPVIYLPNLYPLKNTVKAWDGKTLKIGAFGAVRPQKNLMTAAAAAIVIARFLGVPTEFYISSGREEGGTGTITNAIRQMCKDIPNFELKENPWGHWNNFKEVVGSMDLLIQVSYTESFNMVTADGISMGIPSVVSDAIDWAPSSWKAHADDVLDVAQVGIKLLSGPARELGNEALQRHNEEGIQAWTQYLTGQKQTFEVHGDHEMKKSGFWGRLTTFFNWLLNWFYDLF